MSDTRSLRPKRGAIADALGRVQPNPFGMVPRWLMQHPGPDGKGVSPDAVHLFAVLNDHADRGGRYCYPGMDCLARWCNPWKPWGWHKVKAARDELVVVGALVCVPRSSQGGRTSNLYLVSEAPPDGWADLCATIRALGPDGPGVEDDPLGDGPGVDDLSCSDRNPRNPASSEEWSRNPARVPSSNSRDSAETPPATRGIPRRNNNQSFEEQQPEIFSRVVAANGDDARADKEQSDDNQPDEPGPGLDEATGPTPEFRRTRFEIVLDELGYPSQPVPETLRRKISGVLDRAKKDLPDLTDQGLADLCWQYRATGSSAEPGKLGPALSSMWGRPDEAAVRSRRDEAAGPVASAVEQLGCCRASTRSHAEWAVASLLARGETTDAALQALLAAPQWTAGALAFEIGRRAGASRPGVIAADEVADLTDDALVDALRAQTDYRRASTVTLRAVWGEMLARVETGDARTCRMFMATLEGIKFKPADPALKAVRDVTARCKRRLADLGEPAPSRTVFVAPALAAGVPTFEEIYNQQVAAGLVQPDGALRLDLVALPTQDPKPRELSA